MSCLLTQGIQRSCTMLVAGLSGLVLFNYDEVTSLTATGITMVGAASGYTIQFEDNSAFYLNELQVNGTVRNVKQAITWQTIAEGQDTSDVAEQLAMGRYIALATRKGSGLRFWLGRNSPLTATVTSINSGQAETDSNIGLQVTLEGTNVNYAVEFTGNISSLPISA